jgi:DNA processing protein
LGIYEQIVKRGLVLTEVTPGFDPIQGMFQARNRIIALLVEGIVVIEAAAKSGTLATAKVALDLGCEVMAVPGSPADPRSFGSNWLIKNGAILVQNHIDVLEALGFKEKFDVDTEQSTLNDSSTSEYDSHDISKKVLSLLSTKSVSIDEISGYINIDISKLLCIISELEISGKIIKHTTNEISLA